jgi:putative glycosyltransferase (TIGR04348 family)
VSKPRITIVSPARPAENNGNWHTAARWRRFLSAVADTDIARAWQGEPVQALIALHAKRSAESILRFHELHPRHGLALVLTGTDVYRDLETDASARHALECASLVVALQPQALKRLSLNERAKARVIVQSAPALLRNERLLHTFVAVGHLRSEKDPATLMAAARRIPADSPIEIVHIGTALVDALAEDARATMSACPRYRWLGGLPHLQARRWIACARALVHPSRIEGGANAVIEALRSHVPVLASRIDGNAGLLGADYDAYFEPGDAAALAALMQRVCTDAPFAQRLREQCIALAPAFAPHEEARAVRALATDLLCSTAQDT